MKKKDLEKLKNNPLPELQKKLIDAYENLRKMKFDLTQGKVKNIKVIKEIKKTIARILTIMNKSI
ncbi:MAG: 50S ribosomal protein L29 [Patescibacteria group bacterium]